MDLIQIARKYLGQKEVAGPASNPWIKKMWSALSGGDWFWKSYGSDDGKLPWCGAFVATVCKEAGLPYPKGFASAKSWQDWGQPCLPCQGCIAVLGREGGGHVGIVTGMTGDGKFVRLLGGNQGDAVSEAWFVTSRVIAYRRAVDVQMPAVQLASVGTMSSSEA